MALLVFFAAFVLAATSVHVAGQLPAGSVSIDCGLGDDYSGRKDIFTEIVYVSDGTYVDGGEDHKVDAGTAESYSDASLRTLRSFPSPPSGLRNCYMLPTERGAKYLARMEFLYGNYDGKNSTTVQFDVHLGTNYWDTFLDGHDYWWSEAIFVAWGSWVPMCLVNTGSGTPFVSTVELRPLRDSLYTDVTADQSISAFERVNLGVKTFYRFPDDPYDRYWRSRTSSLWANLSTQVTTIQPDGSFEVPLRVLQTAVTAIGNGTELNVRTWPWDVSSFGFKVFLHFADFQNSQLRQFDVSINGASPYRYSPSYLAASYVYSPGWYKAPDGRYSISLAATNISALPPMINAYEIYNLIAHNNSRTFPKDVDAIMAIKLEYGVKKNWMGDPCFPVKYAWNGVNCSNGTGNTPRITSLDLSNSNLHGVISDNFSMLTELKYLDLSGNRLSGPIPDSLCKSNGGSFILRYDSDGDMCNRTITPPPSRNRTAIISISVVVPMVVVAVLLALSYLIWRGKRKPKISTHDPPREPELRSVQGSKNSQGDPLQNTENRQFTYKELEKCTNKFGHFIGQGGFGLVYYGRLEDDTEVAVKMRSESSSHGLAEFLAEVQSLTKVHHRNLVSLVGYCSEKDHLALVYEYMSRGNLCDHLRGKSGDETLNWGTRVRVALEAAQGLDYLHKGCSLPIIHRDVKTSNILLGQNLRAKIADFGLSKTYISDTQTHISTNAAGSAGYFDPEYYHTGRLTESSDVYSFGVVLLEIATGEPPMAPSHGHIVQRVKQMVATGNISSVADARLGGSYEVTSMWKVVDTAMACTSDAAIGRPTMAAVVAQLKESLALEEARQDRVSPVCDTAVLVSTFGPSAR